MRIIQLMVGVLWLTGAVEVMGQPMTFWDQAFLASVKNVEPFPMITVSGGGDGNGMYVLRLSLDGNGQHIWDGPNGYVIDENLGVMRAVLSDPGWDLLYALPAGQPFPDGTWILLNGMSPVPTSFNLIGTAPP